MDNLNKVFKNGEVLFAEDLNLIVQQVNSNTDAIATLAKTTAMLAKSGYKFAGVAATDETPDTPQQSICKLANAVGEYTGYELEVTQADGVCLFLYDKGAETPAWVKLTLGIPFPGMIVQNVETGTIEAQSNHYYNIAGIVDALDITLPAPGSRAEDVVKVRFVAGEDTEIEINGAGTPVVYSGGLFKDYIEYELTFAFNGICWNVTAERLSPTDSLFFQSASPFSIAILYKGWEGHLQYSIDNCTWNEVTINTAMESASNGLVHRLFLRGYGNTIITGSGIGDNNFMTITSTESVQCLNQLNSLLEYRSTDIPVISSYCYRGIFRNCASLISAPEMPAGSIGQDALSFAFVNCTSLVKAPKLPSTYVANYGYRKMFEGCTSLTSAPELPAKTINTGSYYGMFGGCTSLIKAPSLSAKEVGQYGYREMFKNCTSLTTPPESLGATTAARECYESMFEGCTSLITAPRISATELQQKCFSKMFSDCTSLIAAPDLLATTLVTSCYEYMFQNCTALTNIKMLATTIVSGALANWVKNVAAEGTFTKAAAMTTLTTGTSGIPANWTVVDAA